MVSKLPNVQTSIFSVMSAMANEYGAINLSQGFPDFPIDERLYNLVQHYSQQGFNQYAPMPGVAELRHEIALKIQQEHRVLWNENTEITITSGATQAIFTAISAFLHAGEEAIIFTPAYDSYAPSIELNQGKVIEIPLHDDDFSIDWDHVSKCINAKTKLIIFNNPHNPCGKLFKQEDIQHLARVTENNPNLIIIADEVYEYLVFDNQPFIPVFSYESLRQKTISVYSFGKTFHVTGWKMGYVVAPEHLMKEFRKVHQFNVFGSNHPVQLAIAEYMHKYADYPEISKMYQKKRDLFLNAIQNTKWTFKPTESTYFQLLDYSQISQKSDFEFAEEFTKINKLASIPLSPFYYKHKPQKKYLRFCFAKQDETLKKATDILKVP